MVKKKPTKLTLNVKGEGYAVHDSLQIEGADGRLVELSPDAPNHLDFGQVTCSPWLLLEQLGTLICMQASLTSTPIACSQWLA